MKLNELNKLNENEFDLELNVKRDPKDDQDGRQSNAHRRKPVITLRHINKLKKMKAARRAEEENRRALLGVMYAAPTGEEQA